MRSLAAGLLLSLVWGCGKSSPSSGPCQGGDCPRACPSARLECNGHGDTDCEGEEATNRALCGGCGHICVGNCVAGVCVPGPLQIAASVAHSCGVRAGTIVCWGANGDGQLGDGSTTSRPRGVRVRDMADALAVTVGADVGEGGSGHTCALHATGTVSCWGNGGQGRLGDGWSTTRLMPTAVAALAGVSQVAAGGRHTCALLADGTVRCWGSNSSGQLGNGDTSESQPWPVVVANLDHVVQISTGMFHTCALRGDGSVWCWGANWWGEVTGNPADGNTIPAARQKESTGVRQVSAGHHHTCAVRTNGTVVCWGDSQYKQHVLPTVTDAVEVAAGGIHTCVRRASGAMSCWGASSNGQLGGGDPVTDLTDVTMITAGFRYTCALRSSSATYCWGENAQGQLGDGTLTDRATPQRALTF